MPGDDDMNIDFGDPALNDPEYESKAGNIGAPDDNTPPAPADGGAPNDAPDAQGKPAGADTVTGGQGNQAAPGQQPAGQQSPAKADAADKPRTDDKGNLIDKDGNILAMAGAERRHYERAQQQQRYITRLEGELTEARKADAYAKALNEVPQKLGLSLSEAEMGLQAIASFKKDPVATARWMLQETMRQGYNLQQIVGADAKGQVNGGSLDLQAVRSMISEAVQPLVGDRQAQQRQSEAEVSAQREYDAFVAKHEHATVHEDVLANMMQSDPNVSPQVAYWQLREYAAKNGLDFTKPLRAQVLARQQGGNGTNGHAQPRPNAPQQQHQPMPNGSAPTQAMQQGPNMANPDEAWDVIVRQSLAEAGLLN
jgi:hypothetical protein